MSVQGRRVACGRLRFGQMGLNEFDSGPHDLARPGIVVLVVKTVHAERMVHELQSNVAANRFRDETIEAGFQIWNLILAPPSRRRSVAIWRRHDQGT